MSTRNVKKQEYTETKQGGPMKTTKIITPPSEKTKPVETSTKTTKKDK